MKVRTWLAFGDLAPGARFRFVYGVFETTVSPVVYVKLTNGWYSEESEPGRRFQTHRLTHVRVEEGNGD